MDEELKPCPFCGESLLQEQPDGKYSKFRYHPRNSCIMANLWPNGDTMAINISDDFAISRWNRRYNDK